MRDSVARNLEPNDLDAISKNADLKTTSAPKGTVFYISLNQKNPNLAKPEVRQAFKYLIDYDAMASTILKGIGEIHQTFLPKGDLGELDENPFKLDVAKAKDRRQAWEELLWAVINTREFVFRP